MNNHDGPRDDFAAPWRQNLRAGMPIDAIRTLVRRHVRDLKRLPSYTPDREQAINDMERFEREIARD